MSFLTKLFIGDHEVNVLHCEYSFTQSTDINGKPAARPKGGRIFITVESTSDTDFFDWMISNSQTKSGRITFYRRDNISRMKELVFKDAYCVFFKEKFSSTGDHPMEIELELSAKEITMGNSVFENPWPLG